MREDDRFRHVVPLLRRTIILVAVIIAVPVILWTITAFVRTYVGPPRVPTFHQLAATATIGAPSTGTGQQGAAQLPQNADGSAPVVEARATVSDATKGDQPEGMTNGAAPTSDASGVFPPSPLAGQGGSGTTGALAAAQPTAGNDEGSDALTAAAPLPGPVPLPRRRPRDIEMRTADNANVPIPRRRPETAGSSASPDTPTGNSPLGFIQNIFH
jgi:hypothetical protein